MRPFQYKTPISIPHPSYSKITGTWDPNTSVPTLTTAGDSWLVCSNKGDYEVGDWIIRNRDNTAFTHISANLYTRLMEATGKMIDRLSSRLNTKMGRLVKSVDNKLMANDTKYMNILDEYEAKITRLENKNTVLQARLQAVEDSL